MHCADRRTVHVRVQPSELLADLGRTPVRVLLLETNNQLLDLHRQLASLAVGSAATVGQAIDATIFITIEDLVAGLAGNAELTAQTSHLLAIKQSGDKSETFFHNIALLPGHGTFSCKKEKVLPMCPVWSVTFVSGRTQ